LGWQQANPTQQKYGVKKYDVISGVVRGFVGLPKSGNLI
jgi:hypothetical protein